MAWFSSSIHRKLMAGTVLAILALASLLGFTTWSAMRQDATSSSVLHTNDVLREAQVVRNDLATLQNLELAYAATGSADFLEAFAATRARLSNRLTHLETIVGDSKELQQPLAVRIHEAARGWIERSPAAGAHGPSSLQEIQRLARGVHPGTTLDAIKALLDAFERNELQNLSVRTERDRAARSWTVLAIELGIGLAIVLLLSLSLWLTRSLVAPIAELTRAAASIQGGDYQFRVSPRGDDELSRLGSTFNAMAAVLGQNARELEKRDVQAGVLQIAEVLATASDLPHLLETALQRILEVVRCPAGALWVCDPGEDVLRVLVASGVGPGVLERSARPGEGVVGRVAQTRIAYYTPGDSEPSPILIEQWLGPQRPAELAYIPLTSGPDLVGVLTLAAAGPFDDRARNLLRIVAGQLGATIQNALTHQTLRRQAVELEARNARLAEQRAEIERQNRELRIASQLKSEFLANMSHELRTPLTIILGFTNTVLRGTQGPLNDEQRDSLRRVHENGRQLLGLINDILDLSKIEAGQMEIEPHEFAPAPLLEAVADNFQALARDKGIALRLELDPALPSRLQSDETRVRQVLTNLVSNAVKFTERGRVVLAARPADDRLEIEVRDTGPGIAEADIPKVFEQFRQLDGRTTRRAGGTGLGLSIVKKLVELLGGELEVRSRLGQGTSFLVRLPTQNGEAPAPIVARPAVTVEAPEPTSRPGRSLVLAIDDDEDFLALLRAAVRESPFELRIASNGRDGLALAEQVRPDAIMLDLMMPEMDGWRVLGLLKSNPATAEIPVILLTVLQRRGLGLMLGASDYLTKPVERDLLIRALKKVARPPEAGPILVVDDDPDIRQMLAVELRALGFDRIEAAADGVEGLEKARDLRPELIILDLMMPQMDGFELATRLQDDAATRGIPILVLTARDLTADDVARLNGRIEDIIQKGALSLEALISRLVAVLRSIGIRPA